ELLTGRPPFLGQSIYDILQQVLSELPCPPRQIQADIPPALERICYRCLQKDIKRRCAKASDLAYDLTCFLEGRPLDNTRKAMRVDVQQPAVSEVEKDSSTRSEEAAAEPLPTTRSWWPFSKRQPKKDGGRADL